MNLDNCKYLYMTVLKKLSSLLTYMGYIGSLIYFELPRPKAKDGVVCTLEPHVDVSKYYRFTLKLTEMRVPLFISFIQLCDLCLLMLDSDCLFVYHTKKCDSSHFSCKFSSVFQIFLMIIWII